MQIPPWMLWSLTKPSPGGQRHSQGDGMKRSLVFCGGWVGSKEGMGSEGGWEEEELEEEEGVGRCYRPKQVWQFWKLSWGIKGFSGLVAMLNWAWPSDWTQPSIFTLSLAFLPKLTGCRLGFRLTNSFSLSICLYRFHFISIICLLLSTDIFQPSKTSI